jgi:uncharacterized protein (TIGR03435 family)
MDNVYDIEAKADDLKSLSSPRDREDKLRLMLQALLAERFKLTLRRRFPHIGGSPRPAS